MTIQKTSAAPNHRIAKGTSGKISGGYLTHRPRGHRHFCLLPWLLPRLGSGVVCLGGWRGSRVPRLAGTLLLASLPNGCIHRPVARLSRGKGSFNRRPGIGAFQGIARRSVSRIAKILSAKVRRSPPPVLPTDTWPSKLTTLSHSGGCGFETPLLKRISPLKGVQPIGSDGCGWESLFEKSTSTPPPRHARWSHVWDSPAVRYHRPEWSWMNSV